jgi:hypothetical protein
MDRPGPARRWPLVERHRQRSRKTLLASLIRQPSAGAASVRPRVTRACHSSSLGMYELHAQMRADVKEHFATSARHARAFAVVSSTKMPLPVR